MQLSCLPVSLYRELAAGRLTLGGWFRMAATLGLDGADLSVAHLAQQTPDSLDAIRREATDAGVRIVMLATYSDFTLPDAAERAREVDGIRGWIEVAGRLGARFLRLTAGQDRDGLPEQEAIAWVVEGLTACLDEAEAAGVRLLYENHVRGAVWSNNDFTQPAKRFLQVARATEGSSLGILFDTANNLALGDDPLLILSEVKDRVGAVHVSDIRRVGAFEPTVIGSGVAPITESLRIMVEAGFDGWLSVEEASHAGMQGFRQAVTHADHAWQEAGGRARKA